MKKIIIIGSGAAGAKAAAKAKRTEPNNEIELYTDIDKIAFSLCGLPYYIEGSVDDINKLIVRTPQDFEKNGIKVFLNHKLEKIIPDKNIVIINGEEKNYDNLILALGASVRIPNVKNIDGKNIFTLRSLESAVEIREKMLNSKSVLVIGGGYSGIEMIEAFSMNNLKVYLAEKSKRLMRDFDEEFSNSIENIIKEKLGENLELHLDEELNEIFLDENQNFKSAKFKSGLEIEADFCVLLTGAIANVEIARKAGIQLGTTGAIYVDSKMRTNFRNIFACGDCCEKYSTITKEPLYIGLGTIANKEGRIAGINASQDEYTEVFEGILSSSVTKFYDFTFAKTGLSEQDVQKHANYINIEPISTTITKKDKAGYMPKSAELTLKIIADKRSGEILGAQAIGFSGNVMQRINAISSALKSRLKVYDLIHLDLGYTPGISSTIDPIITAMYKLNEILKK